MAEPRSDARGDIETQRLTGPPLAPIGVKRMEASIVLLVVVWMVFSSVMVIYNKWIFSVGGFPYPLALTSMHMTCCFVVFGGIRKLLPQRIRLTLMPDADVEIPWSTYCKTFVPISVFYAGTLGLGNLAYLFASVAFIQMLKPMNVICASLASFVIGMEVPTVSHFIIVSVIASGIMTATTNAGVFSVLGCGLQMVSSLSEGCRLALVQKITTGGLKLDPVTTVYHFSAPSALFLWCAFFALEWPRLDLSKLISAWVLVVNCALALLLNVLVASVIKQTSAVVFALSGIIKDLGIIGASSFLFMTPITRLMMVGYSVSVMGLYMYKAYKDNLELFAKSGFFSAMPQVIMSTIKPALAKKPSELRY